MISVADRTRPLLEVTVGVILGVFSFVACASSASFSDELVCGDLVLDDGSQVFVSSSCDVEHTAERFFLFEAPFDDYDSHDVEVASGRYCLQRFIAHYDLGDGKWATSGYDFVGIAPNIEDWNQGKHEIACVAFLSDGSVFP